MDHLRRLTMDAHVGPAAFQSRDYILLHDSSRTAAEPICGLVCVYVLVYTNNVYTHGRD